MVITSRVQPHPYVAVVGSLPSTLRRTAVFSLAQQFPVPDTIESQWIGYRVLLLWYKYV